jgi:hypothetical protein
MKILFCVPAYGSEVRVETALTLATSVLHITQNVPGAAVQLFAVDLAEIGRVRNLFASMTLEQGYDALLMLDSDMSMPADTFTRLLMSPYDVCGVTYPKREIDLERFHAMAKAGADFETARTGSLNFIAADSFVHQNGTFAVDAGFLQMKELPGGCLMIRRAVFEKLWKSLPEIRQIKHVSDVEARVGLTKIIRCFDNIVENGTKCSEDISFFKRWASLGGKAYGLFDVPVAHYGAMKFEGRYSDNLMARATNVQPLASKA